MATNAGGTIEVVTNKVNGFLVEVGDAPSLERAIKKLLENKQLREKFVRAGSKTIERDFDFVKMVNLTEGLLLKMNEAN